MAKQKLELKFWGGVFVGAFAMLLACSYVLEKNFVSKDIFKLRTIYIDGRLYKLCSIQ